MFRGEYVAKLVIKTLLFCFIILSIKNVYAERLCPNFTSEMQKATVNAIKCEGAKNLAECKSELKLHTSLSATGVGFAAVGVGGAAAYAAVEAKGINTKILEDEVLCPLNVLNKYEGIPFFLFFSSEAWAANCVDRAKMTESEFRRITSTAEQNLSRDLAASNKSLQDFKKKSLQANIHQDKEALKPIDDKIALNEKYQSWLQEETIVSTAGADGAPTGATYKSNKLADQIDSIFNQEKALAKEISQMNPAEDKANIEAKTAKLKALKKERVNLESAKIGNFVSQADQAKRAAIQSELARKEILLKSENIDMKGLSYNAQEFEVLEQKAASLKSAQEEIFQIQHGLKSANLGSKEFGLLESRAAKIAEQASIKSSLGLYASAFARPLAAIGGIGFQLASHAGEVGDVCTDKEKKLKTLKSNEMKISCPFKRKANCEYDYSLNAESLKLLTSNLDVDSKTAQAYREQCSQLCSFLEDQFHKYQANKIQTKCPKSSSEPVEVSLWSNKEAKPIVFKINPDDSNLDTKTQMTISQPNKADVVVGYSNGVESTMRSVNTNPINNSYAQFGDQETKSNYKKYYANVLEARACCSKDNIRPSKVRCDQLGASTSGVTPASSGATRNAK